ncbi:MAG: aldo/keto reductase [Gaiellaceae bacterium]
MSETLSLGGDLTVRRLGLGTMGLTGRGVWGESERPDEARRLLRRAVELGVTFIDTADSYGPETCERLIAEALHPYPDGLAIATKGGLTRSGPGRWSPNGRPDHLRTACEGSLRRLRLERIDVYQLHAVDPDVPLEESVGALAELRDEGKVRHVGVSNVDAAQLARARAVVPIVSVQNRFSLAERSSEAVLELCEREELAFIAWAPLAKGFLGGARGRPARIASARGITRSQLALAWLLGRSPATIAIPGSSSLPHLEENLGAAGISLGDEELAALARYRSAGYAARRLRRRARVALGRLKGRVRG